jgi:hypothetical protein
LDMVRILENVAPRGVYAAGRHATSADGLGD